jgi:mannan endo-1,4-beta-mannosidase
VKQANLLAAALLALLSATTAGAQIYRFEAESATLFGTNVANSIPGYSGSGYITNFDNSTDSLTLNVNGVPAGLYNLYVGYNSPYGHKDYQIQVGSEIGEGSLDGTAANQFSVDRTGVFQISSGTNTLKITDDWGYYNVDYLELRPATIREPSPVAPHLVDPQATARTQMLMNYLTSMYGVKSLAGQMSNIGQDGAFPSSSYLAKSGGLVPAIRGSDFIDYSPSRIAHGSNPNGESERIINWAKSTGGIPTMSWHWNAPTDLIDTPGKEWWRGFYTDSTNFDVQAALASPGSPKYNLLLSDIDAIGTQLQKFQTAGVPVIWRPLHEAQGGWFWWGAKGPQAFKDLWHLMYNRLTNVDGLHNLIWEYTSSSADQGFRDWYPGDDVVDIVGADVYTDASSSMSGPWNDLLDEYDGKKMIALSESGTLPDASVMRQRDIGWSYFSPWNGSYMDNLTATQLQSTLNDPDVVTLNKLPLLPWANTAPVLPGDYNHDGIVDAADYTMWRDSIGQTVTKGNGADGNGNGLVDSGDYDVWRLYFGQSSGGSAASAAVPEPAACFLAFCGFLGLAMAKLCSRCSDLI